MLTEGSLRLIEVGSSLVITCIALGAVLALAYLIYQDFVSEKGLYKKVARFMNGLQHGDFEIVIKKYASRHLADVHLALSRFLKDQKYELTGIKKEYGEAPDIGSILTLDILKLKTTSPNYSDIDFPDDQVVRAVISGLYLAEVVSTKILIHIRPSDSYIDDSFYVEIAYQKTASGDEYMSALINELETGISSKSLYRGKCISLTGQGLIRFVPVKEVNLDDLVLPEPTLESINRNIIDFANRLADFHKLGQNTKKGLLMWGPPGTGKSQAIAYIKSQLKSHTLISLNSENQKLIGEIFRLSKLLQPSLIIIEDVDLLAKSREIESGHYSNMLLKLLMNEMDGVAENSDICLVLTTNRPEVLEDALVNRPGRIDTVIKIDYPDEGARKRLLLRSIGDEITVESECTSQVVKRTEGTSGAFIQELARRAIHEMLLNDDSKIQIKHFDYALNELFSGTGELSNLLLGVRRK